MTCERRHWVFEVYSDGVFIGRLYGTCELARFLFRHRILERRAEYRFLQALVDEYDEDWTASQAVHRFLMYRETMEDGPAEEWLGQAYERLRRVVEDMICDDPCGQPTYAVGERTVHISRWEGSRWRKPRPRKRARDTTRSSSRSA